MSWLYLSSGSVALQRSRICTYLPELPLRYPILDLALVLSSPAPRYGQHTLSSASPHLAAGLTCPHSSFLCPFLHFRPLHLLQSRPRRPNHAEEGGVSCSSAS